MESGRAPLIGRGGPRPDGRDRAFWDGLAGGRLMLQRCAACGRWIWPAQWACPSCHAFDPPWEEVEPVGTVFTWTRTWQRFTPEFAELVPYVNVVVALDAVPIRLLGLLLGDDAVDPVIGDRVCGVIQPPSELTGGAAVLRWERA
jgi:uncharacterized OB-fold protein